MEDISNALYFDTVPETWANRAYPSLLNLAAWFTDLLIRIRVRRNHLTEYFILLSCLSLELQCFSLLKVNIAGFPH